MAKIGDKFIIEIDAELKNEFGDKLYRIKGFNSLVFDKNGLDKLKKLDLKKEYSTLFDDAEREARDLGRREAWDLVRKLDEMSFRCDCNEEYYFGGRGAPYIYNNFSYDEVSEKMKQYEEDKKESTRYFSQYCSHLSHCPFKEL